jgi:AcrR family transcriptional regulator
VQANTPNAQSAKNASLNTQCDRILAAVFDVVSDRGYIDTTAVEIILRAGVSSKTFYKYFPSKESAFRALLQAQATRIFTASEAASQTSASWPMRVQASVRELLVFLTENPTIARLGIVEHQTAGAEAIAEFQRWLRRYADSLAPRPSEGSGFAPPRTGVSDQIAGAISQLLYDTFSGIQPGSPTDLLPDILEITLAPYIGPRRASTFIATHLQLSR